MVVPLELTGVALFPAAPLACRIIGMKAISLQSGSNGNCIYVEADGVRLLFDAGISGKQAQLRLAAHGRDISHVDGVLVSHDHSDHSRCLGIYQRKFAIPAHVTAKTLDAAMRRCSLGKMSQVNHFQAGDTLRFGKVSVETVPTPHDGADGVAFVIDDGRRRLGILTDLGHVFSDLEAVIASLDAVFIESNYNRKMLAEGSYPEFLKARIRGPGGHLSNTEAAELLLGHGGGRLKTAYLSHLSGDNNSPEVALGVHKKILGERLELHVASRHASSGVLDV
jgi:phosphoribosyl 1,2-cyclic phosphodiesterase